VDAWQAGNGLVLLCCKAAQSYLRRRPTRPSKNSSRQMSPMHVNETAKTFSMYVMLVAYACSPSCSHVKKNSWHPTLAHHSPFSNSLSSLSLSSISHISSSVNVFFFLPSLSFFSISLIAFLASLGANFCCAFTSILLPAAS